MFPKVGAWYAGIDYVRLTAKRESYHGDMEAVYRKAARTIVAEANQGEVHFKPWAWLGYYGEACAGVSYGSGAQGAILQVSGWQAQDVRAMGLPFDGVPRVDVQLTIWFEEDSPSVAQRVADRSHQASGSFRGGRWKTRYIDGKGDGDTAYIGSRTSDCFLRVYDKFRERGKDPDYAGAWRFEAEYKNERAKEAWAAEGTSAPGADYWCEVVRRQLRGRGIYLPVLSDTYLSKTPPRPKVENEAERRLAWLYNQVRPSIDKLRAQGVSYERVMQALGLVGAECGEPERSCGVVANWEEFER